MYFVTNSECFYLITDELINGSKHLYVAQQRADRVVTAHSVTAFMGRCTSGYNSIVLGDLYELVS